MECRELHVLLPALRGGELEQHRAREAERHLESCSGCRDLAERDRAFENLLRARLGATAPAPEALRERVRTCLEPAPRRDWAARVFGSRWAPRFAFATVVAVIVLVPVLWLGHGTPALATAAAERHACHGPTSDGSLPPCCTALAVRPGDPLGPPLHGVVVPDLGPVGLAFVRATRCTFGDSPVIFLTYALDSGERFSLYIADRGAREFKLLRHEARDGVPQARHVVALGADARHPATRVDVLMWLRRGLLFTWVGPAGTNFEAACGVLQATP